MDLPQQVIEIDGDLTLRRFRGEADLPEFFQVIEESLEHLRPWLPWVAEHSLARTAGFLESRAACWAEGEEYSYAVVLDGAIVGACGLYRYEDTPDGTRELGYWLHPAATGRGVATRAARALVDQAFRLPGVEHVEAVHAPDNRTSAAVPPRLGFTEVQGEAGTGAGPDEVRVWRLTRPRESTATVRLQPDLDR
jgi:RimJ/RimL family protein N-acetyltransferase